MNNFNLNSCVFILLVSCEYVLVQPVLDTESSIDQHEDTKLNFTGFSYKYGNGSEEYQVTTEDGYILTLFHIPGWRCSVYLQHGFIDSADTFIIRGKRSLALTLSRAGYDVWLGNARGNKYSRKHKYLNPDNNKEFWDYSMHELAVYDIPAMIDFILEKTGRKKIVAVGHSQGNAVFYVLGATRPEYNDKIQVLIALAPIAYLHHVKDNSPYNVLLPLSPFANDFLKLIGHEELFKDKSAVKLLIESLCTALPLKYQICIEGGLFFLAGADPDEIDKKFTDIIMTHYPSATSRKNAWHLGQIAESKRFQHYDYGKELNVEIYGNEVPPEYDLSKVTMKVHLLTGKNDKLSTIKDVNLLHKKLPKSVYTLIDRNEMSHLDFVWGKHMNQYLYPLILQILKENCNKS